MARREHEARTKRGGSALFLTDKNSRAERLSEARKANKIFNLSLLLQKFLQEFEGAFFKKHPQKKEKNKKKHKSCAQQQKAPTARAVRAVFVIFAIRRRLLLPRLRLRAVRELLP